MPGNGECAAARDTGRFAPHCGGNQRGRHHLWRPLHLLHRHARRIADRDRLEWRLPDRPHARRRHHEPRPFHALHAVPRPAHPPCAARLGRGRAAREDLGKDRRRPDPQRHDRHPPLLWRLYRRQHDQGRQLDLHLRGRRALHRPSRPPARETRRQPFRGDRPDRHPDGADRRHLHHVARRHLRYHPAAPRLRGAADAPLRDAAGGLHAADRQAVRDRPAQRTQLAHLAGDIALDADGDYPRRRLTRRKAKQATRKIWGANIMVASTAPTTRSGLYADPNEKWLALHTEEIIDPARPIIDPHHHLWDRGGVRYLMEEMTDDVTSGHNIVATVYVEARSMYRNFGPEAFRPVGEVEFVNGAAAMAASGAYGKTLVAHGIVGHANLLLGDGARAVLEAEIAAGNGRFRGIRHSSPWDADKEVAGIYAERPKGLLLDSTFRKGFACLAPLGLSFDGWLFFTQLGEFADLARAFPDTKICLDHCGGIIGVGSYANRRDEIFKTWKAS